MILNEPAGKIAQVVVQDTVKLLVQVCARHSCIGVDLFDEEIARLGLITAILMK